eukprot:1058632-Rhodomonas_salina.3
MIVMSFAARFSASAPDREEAGPAHGGESEEALSARREEEVGEQWRSWPQHLRESARESERRVRGREIGRDRDRDRDREQR